MESRASPASAVERAMTVQGGDPCERLMDDSSGTSSG